VDDWLYAHAQNAVFLMISAAAWMQTATRALEVMAQRAEEAEQK
jgi:hypothetical protein